ncbi:hypothetical protein K505DRAFT_330826 [Melanomma pulvis-pyrius CBS 109.77]|uniref:Uncharacterized protein n=1 Tax=Melanomma pulvis-pyrius CBS 109.77 TaxID=1314802 RepID=A0A6A6WPA8_9PLEO|nr:hypothetical protein K505DRAFT_330826 [Melanomma pulvis-pyrius CBS 109.77]
MKRTVEAYPVEKQRSGSSRHHFALLGVLVPGPIYLSACSVNIDTRSTSQHLIRDITRRYARQRTHARTHAPEHAPLKLSERPRHHYTSSTLTRPVLHEAWERFTGRA